MTITIAVTAAQIERLDVGPVTEAIAPLLATGGTAGEQQVQFAIADPREANDPRELSEIGAIRLWFLRVDSAYPWLPFFLDWKAGELGRYAAMLVPHQFHPTDGIQFNPEALELFLMQKLFVLADWFRDRDITATPRLKGLAQMLGYDLEDEFFERLR
jgi:hypothetical protein